MLRIVKLALVFGLLSILDLPFGAPLGLLPAQLAAQQAAASVVTGSVLDPDSELVPGATVTLTPASGRPTVVTSGSDGTYRARIAPGTYSLTITMQGFAAFTRLGLKLTPGQTLSLNAKLALQDETQQVMVTADPNTVSVDADSNASSVVIKGDALDALSDDSDELSDELSALAGPAAGPNGGQIYIDGFTGGQLPPKSSIREIRINQNPFSAQYDRLGFGRVEIFTKPGTDKFHGSAQLNAYDSAFNTKSPLLGDTAITPYHTIFFLGNLTGPINHFASFTLSGSRRDIQDNAVVNPNAIYSNPSSPGTYCAPATAGCVADTTFTQSVLTPQTRWDISPRLDLALGQKNTLTTRFQYTTNSEQNQGIGGNSLPSTGYNTDTSEVTLQMSDTQIVNEKVINETRFEYQRTPSIQTPFSTAPTLNVEGAFTGGGASSQSSNVVSRHIEVQNYTSIALKKNFIRLGGRLRTTGETSTSTSGANGTFSYSSIAAYQTNTPTQYSITVIPTPTITLRDTDVGIYAEDDWKPKANLTISYGIRYETQNFIHDHADFAPRLSFATGLGRGKAPKTVLRGGFGLFFDRFQIGNEATVVRNNGSNQIPYLIEGANLGACSPTDTAACVLGSSSQTTTYAIAPNLRAPYTMQSAIGIDQQLFKGATISFNYLNARGTHQFLTENESYILNGPSTTSNQQYQYQSEGAFRQNQINVNISYRVRNATLWGFNSINFADSNTNGIGSFPTVPGNPGADYGRAGYDVRDRLALGGSLGLKYGVQFAPFMIANSGSPYNLTTGNLDTNGDSLYSNQRVEFVPAGYTGTTKTIAGCGTFADPSSSQTTYAEVPVDYCTGPANFTLNVRLTKTFGFGPRTGPPPQRGGQQGGPQGGFGGPPGGGRGGGGRGGPGGGPGGGGFGTNTGRRYNLTFGAQGTNVFNIADRGTPVGTFTSPEFGHSTQLAGGIFTTTSAVRRVMLQALFTF